MFTEKVYDITKGILTAVLVGSFNILLASGGQDTLSAADKIMNKMTLEEKVGQIIWLEVNDKTHDLEGLLKKIKPAGIEIRSTDPYKIKKWSRIASSFTGNSPVLVSVDISLVKGITLFPEINTIRNISGSDNELVKQYQEAVASQMAVLGVDRVNRYGADLGFNLKNITGNAENLKKTIFRSDGIIIPSESAFWYGEIFRLVKTGEIPYSFFVAKVKKVLENKSKSSTEEKSRNKNMPDYLFSYRIKSAYDKSLAEHLYLKSFTLYKNEKNNVPVGILANKKIINISREKDKDIFNEYLNLYTPTGTYQYTMLQNIDIEYVKTFDYVFLEISDPLLPSELAILNDLDDTVDLFITCYGGAEQLAKLQSLSTVLWSPEMNETTKKIAPQVLFGGFGNNPRSIEPVRLSYTTPEFAEMDSRTLDQIDDIIKELLDKKATPGCQVLVAREGHVVYNKSFGSLFYGDSLPVTSGTLYDLASITKVLATLPAVMYLDQVDLLDIDQKASNYLLDLRGTNKENIIIRNILVHQAGLYPYLPFWRQTVNEDGPIPELYSKIPDSNDWKLVSKGLYSNEALQDSLWKWTIESKMRKAPHAGNGYDYKYSDLGFYIMKELVERISGMKLDQFAEKYLYNPMGLDKLTFLPLRKFSPEQIAPTEYDSYFRKGLIHGTVHDQIAAMFGGVAGHAGLFGNTNDLAKLMQMFLWMGEYGGARYFDEETIKKYIEKQNSDNRRGLGWDKPDPQAEGNTSSYASFSSFGHTGFTGTSVWADPDMELIYVFLSNRIHPDSNNNKLSHGNYRIRIQDVIYKSIHEYEKGHSF